MLVIRLPVTREGRELMRLTLPMMRPDGTFPDGSHISETDWDESARLGEQDFYRMQEAGL